MIASVHIADVGRSSAWALLRRPPRPGWVRGLRYAGTSLAAPLTASVLPRPRLGRVGLVAFWDDDGALDRFLRDDPRAQVLAPGWQVRLEPVRAFGHWPGLPTDLPTERSIDTGGPAVVLSMGQVRPTHVVRFLRASAKAQAAVLAAPGLVWGTGLGRPPCVATCTVWESTAAVTRYAYGRRDPAHPDAIAADEAKPFNRRSAFIRFRPTGSRGQLDGRDPLAVRVGTGDW